MPVSYTLYCLAVTVGSFGLVLSRRFAPVIPSVQGRATAFVALCLVPQFWETATVLASLIFVGGVALIVLGLSRAPRPGLGRVGELVGAGLLGLSGPLIAFFAPLFAYRWLRERNAHNALLAGVVGTTAAIQVWVFARSGRVAAVNTFDYLPRAYVQRVAGEFLTSSPGAKDQYVSGGSLAIVATVWLLAVVAVILIEVRWRGLLGLGVTVLAFAWAVRTYDFLLLDPVYGDRHVLVPSAVLLVLLVGAVATAFGQARVPGRQRLLHLMATVVGAVALLMTLPGITAGFAIPAYSHVPTPQELGDFQRCMDQGDRGCAPVLIAPKGFKLDPNHPWDPDRY